MRFWLCLDYFLRMCHVFNFQLFCYINFHFQVPSVCTPTSFSLTYFSYPSNAKFRRFPRIFFFHGVSGFLRPYWCLRPCTLGAVNVSESHQGVVLLHAQWAHWVTFTLELWCLLSDGWSRLCVYLRLSFRTVKHNGIFWSAIFH